MTKDMINHLSTKDALIRAAIHVFAQKGFIAATIRDISGLAGANVASVNYHFRNKEGLYEAVLEFIFSFHEKHRKAVHTPQLLGLTPEERLDAYITENVLGMYGNSTKYLPEDIQSIKKDMSVVFSMAMAQPDDYLEGLIHKYIQPSADRLKNILKDILGKEAPHETVARCALSIWGQIAHYRFTEPLADTVEPVAPTPDQQPEEFARHLYVFTIGGLKAIKDSLGQPRLARTAM